MKAITPELLDTAERLGKHLRSSCIIKDVNESQAIVIALECIQMGISIFEFNERYDMVYNKRAKKSERMLAEFKAMEGCSYNIIQRDSEGAIIGLTENDKYQIFKCIWSEVQGEDFCTVYGKKDTKKEKPLIHHNYKDPRKRMQMLWARVVSDSIRAFAPEITAGLYTPEEVSDFSEEDDKIPGLDTSGDGSIFNNKSSLKIAEEIADETTEAKNKQFTPVKEKSELDDAVNEVVKEVKDLLAVKELMKKVASDTHQTLTKPKETPPIDYNICPAGENTGEKWVKLTEIDLEVALKWIGKTPKLPEEYRSYVEEAYKKVSAI